MAPQVKASRDTQGAAQTGGAVPKPMTEQERALAALRKHVEANSEYVGMQFAKEARAMHDGDAPGRAIYGEARLDEAKKLVEDGIPVAPLPFMPKAKTH